MTPESDADAVGSLRAGDAHAFDHLMRKHLSTVYKYAWAIADSPDQVDDAVQDTFMTLWRRRRRVVVHGETLLPWLLTTCRYTLFNANRARRRHASIPLDAVSWIAAEGSDPQSSQLRWIRDEIASLPEPDQRLIEACVLRGESYDQAAIALGITAPAARKRMQRIRARLRTAELEG
ncbi:sigma-70 family RNA polymerase sigma factor [Microbacterium paludicola]|jgi:RNA polymerase sigma-70 factor (ECF subfamily)|uniref:Sigma-70 family RNA polymerase sigma factor n=1 Tax=Microbacterium paludicola TaxID=300019 RepID=A0A4Y9FUQ2_9MICO|nr:sigma-70 family RNA polymerase sigma factor [Microbacterium paludicola]MBF0816247.1 sigma-70 family RNA polymerase sigma factor [Microbacterium paludicola]TFU33050.1 sigma-70 family RNA polymerase sigma factor [Microbacterium paludicola]